MKNALLVFLGGGLGSVLRYGVDSLLKRSFVAFPLGTFAVNALGAFLLGFLVRYLSAQPPAYRSSIYLLLGTGFCGGFTTFSAFILEAIQGLEREHPPYFFLYLILSLTVGLLAGYWGYKGLSASL